VAAQTPVEVLKIALAIPDTDNVRVHEDLLEIARQLPGEMAARLVRKEARWLRAYEGHLLSLPKAGGEVLAHLARQGESKAAFELARALLRIRQADEPTGARRRAVASMSDYSYREIIQGAWPALVEADAPRAFGFLCDRLAEVIQVGFVEPADGHDLTYVWRSAIEDHAQNVGDSLLDALVDAVRDCALDLAQTVSGLEVALDELRKRPAPLFRRTALHVVRERGSADLVAAALLDEDNADNTDVWHDYGELLRHRFSDLAPEQQSAVLDLIARGPDVELTPALEKRGVTAPDLQQHARHWRLKRYTLIAQHLQGEAQRAYETLREEFGEPEHPTFLTYSRSWTGPTAPFSVDELREMGPRGVASTLREWTPAEGSEKPTPEGLGRILQATVSADATAFAVAAREFVDLDPTYVRALFSGLAEAAKSPTEFPWGPVLELGEWVVAQPRSASDTSDDWDRDTHWGRARKDLASLLSQGFAEGVAEIPLDRREQVWRLLAALAEDPDPTPEHEERYGGDNMDPATLAINTTRGESLHAVIRYMFWVERALANSGEFNGMDSIPEARNLLEHHLDPTVDGSLAIRAVYGQWFPQLVRIDSEWARSIAPAVFPDAPELDPYFHAAWNAYVVFNRPFTDVFQVLAERYRLAVERLGKHPGRVPLAGNPGERLGDHLLSLRIQGVAEGDKEDLFAHFWTAASPELRREVLSHAGWSLEQTPTLEPEVRQRLASTWEWIFEDAQTGDSAPLSAFGAWLGSQALDGSWLLEQAQAVLALGVHLEPDFVVYRAVQRLASDNPRQAIEVLRGMVLTDTEGWSISGSTDEVRAALAVALAADDAETRTQATTLIHLLGARGMTTFRDLVSAE
jgi:hypothetical protein